MAPGWVQGTPHQPHLSWAAPGRVGGRAGDPVFQPRHGLSFPRNEVGALEGLRPDPPGIKVQRSEGRDLVPCPAYTCYPTSSSPELSQTTVSAQTTARGGACEGAGEGPPTSWWSPEGQRGSSALAAPSRLLQTPLLPGEDTSVDSRTPKSPVDPQVPQTPPGLVDSPKPCSPPDPRDAPQALHPRSCFVPCCPINLRPRSRAIALISDSTAAPRFPDHRPAVPDPMPPPPWHPPTPSLSPTGQPWSAGTDAVVSPKGSYHELNAGVPACPAWPMPSSPVGAVACVSPPPPAQHRAAGSWAPSTLHTPGPLPPGCFSKVPARTHSTERLTHPRGLWAGASRPVLFRDGRGFHELPLLPGEHGGARGQWPEVGGLGSGRLGVSSLQLSIVAASGPHCCWPPPPQLSGPRDGPGPHWRALPPPQEKASGGRQCRGLVTQTCPPPSRASACPSTQRA